MTSGELPALFVGRRRMLFAALAAMGLAQAGLSVGTAFLTPRLLSGSGSVVGLSVVLIAAGLVVGAGRIGERVFSEELGQDYVREIRKLLVHSALVPQGSLNLGSTIARSTNDLTAVKNWVALGISPIVVGVPLITGVVVAMFLLTPAFAVVIVVVLTATAAIMLALSRPLYRRARKLRRTRGKMAGYIADAVTAGEAIRISGGVRREVQRVDRLSAQVMERARQRALISGAMRGSAASTTAMLAVLMAVVGAAIGATAADITTAVFISGMLAAPITDLGRVSEYRQNLNAARKVLAPILANARRHRRHERSLRARSVRALQHGDPPGLGHGAVHVADLVDREGTIPDLLAAPGSRVLLVGESDKRTRRVLAELTSDRDRSDGWVTVSGQDVGALPAKLRRNLIGVASRNTPIERGTISRVARYRVPDAEIDLDELLDAVGLREVVAKLPDGVNTGLRRGGEPLAAEARAALKLARALAGTPPLLVLDHIDDHLSHAGRARLRNLLAEYPGCIILRSNNPESLLPMYDVWNVDELVPTVVLARPAHELASRGPRATTHVAGSGSDAFGPPVRRSSVDREAAGPQDTESGVDEMDDE